MERQPEAAYLKVPGRGALAPPDHAVLRALAAWRETEVQARNMPRRHLIRDDVLIMVGGAPVTQEFADDMGADGYGKDALACVELAKVLLKV